MKPLNSTAIPTFIGTLLVGVFASQLLASEQPAEIFSSILPSLERQTEVPIRLPSHLPEFRFKIYVTSSGDQNSYQVDIGTVPNCHGATVCFIGYFTAKRGDQPHRNNSVSGKLSSLELGGKRLVRF